jgi:hypothetical protein
MHAVAWLVQVQHRKHDPGPSVVSTDAAGRLDIFRSGLWLALHDHKSETGDIEANRYHVGRQGDVDSLCIPTEYRLEALLPFRDLVG